MAEFIVAQSLGIAESIRSPWDAYDLLHPYGIKIEVKSSAYIQAWYQKKLSNITFGIGKIRVPESPEGQMVLFDRLMNMVDEDFKIGMLDWGEFVDDNTGYSISEGTEQDLNLALMKYSPYIKFKVHPVLSASQIEENMKALSQA